MEEQNQELNNQTSGPEDTPIIEQVVTEEEVKTKKIKSWMILVPIIILVLAGGAYAAFFTNLKSYLPFFSSPATVMVDNSDDLDNQMISTSTEEVSATNDLLQNVPEGYVLFDSSLQVAGFYGGSQIPTDLYFYYPDKFDQAQFSRSNNFYTFAFKNSPEDPVALEYLGISVVEDQAKNIYLDNINQVLALTNDCTKEASVEDFINAEFSVGKCQLIQTAEQEYFLLGIEDNLNYEYAAYKIIDDKLLLVSAQTSKYYSDLYPDEQLSLRQSFEKDLKILFYSLQLADNPEYSAVMIDDADNIATDHDIFNIFDENVNMDLCFGEDCIFNDLPDTDGDLLLDLEETDIYHTDPNNPDTDGDGYADGEEVNNGYNPLGAGMLEL